MTDYSFGDIVLVPFPFTDQSTVKKRPAVIVSSNAYNKKKPDIIIMAVTSIVFHHSLYRYKSTPSLPSPLKGEG